MRGKAFVSGTGPSAVIRRSENTRIFDSFESKLPAIVAPTSRAAPVRPRCPERLFSAPQTGRCACSRHKNVRRCMDAPRRGAAWLPCFPFIHALKTHTLSPKQGFADRQRCSVFLSSKAVFRGCSSQQSPEKCAL